MSLLRRLADLFRGPSADAPLPLPPTPPPVSANSGDAQPPRFKPALIVEQICKETQRARADHTDNLSESQCWRSLKERPSDIQIAVMFAVLDRYRATRANNWRMRHLYQSMLTGLLRRHLPLTGPQLADLLVAWDAQPYGLHNGLPGPTILGAVERYAEKSEVTGPLKNLLVRIQKRAASGSLGQAPTKASRSLAHRVGRLLDASGTGALPTGPFAHQIEGQLTGLSPERRAPWGKLVALAAEGGVKAKPGRKWLQAMQEAMAALDRSELTREVLHLLDVTTPDPTGPDQGLDMLRGLVWASVHLDRGQVVGPLGRFADKCFRKVPGVGARSVSLGNAAIWALSEMADEPRAAAELFRLRERIKYASIRNGIDARLGSLAHRTGQTVQDLEDLSLPDFGLSEDGVATFRIGEARADVTTAADGLRVQWCSRDGKPLKSVPAEVRKDHPAALADLRRRVKEIEEARAGQVLRFEQSWVERRDWSFADWRVRYLRHPLRRPVVQGLIWRVGSSDLMVAGDGLVDVEGRAQEVPADARVRLWHPLDAAPQEVLAWRRRILALGVTQPIKQAHREIYVLTDAERRTGVYSNRFAAHILRQHQFRALCQARGWRYGLMGGWDGYNTPTRALPGLSVEYQVEVLDDGRQTASGVALYLTTDQVRFTDDSNQTVELHAVSPIVFSEVLRDVDLFVAVTSVANDPGWTDGGPEGRNAGDWREWAFGDLGQSAQTRRELIAWIAPRLTIADKLEVTDKFLVVTGRRQGYAIHFRSGNIQTRPGNRYLCVVPDHDPAETARIKLPFTGDGLLSTILAKAFLLVDEDKIKDRTILNQL